ncbi:IS21 family transposase [Paramaledivibacter caminithermalis]|uniref:Transposase n=1 Tax=Paramaledivibacter caminithermalis (strain DSM 15212 / CIP 107654 / DViRD3) TaxID=1121301 RepID=A0A1M6T8S3_PARC5|nr:IS21 family transposase [Paramaledivibacter caminithermalis]SHK53350.1 Transposase [Paramaledivibacter caminithermalis DSM 15212]
MVTLNQKAEIIISYFREGISQREISRRLGVDRKTVRKYINQYEDKLNRLSNADDEKEVSILIEELSSKPKYDTSKRKKRKLNDEIISLIDEYLKENDEKKMTGRSKQIMKNIDIYEQIIEKGYDISYPSICNYIREKGAVKEAFIRQNYSLGETLEFDWGEVKLNIDGKNVTLDMGLFTTAAGSYHFARLYKNKKMENFLDIHVKALEHLGGVHKEIVYDNMKQAVKRFVGKNEKEATEDLVKISMYYGFRYRFCNIRRGNEKGHVERGVETVRRKVFSVNSKFKTFEEANTYLQEKLLSLNSKSRDWLEGKSPMDILNDEKEYLYPLKPTYDVSRVVEARVSKYSVITVDQNKYSTPDYLVGKFVTAKIYTDTIKIFYKNNLVATHKRNYENHKWIVDINHYIQTLKKKPGALKNSAVAHQMPPELKKIYQEYYINNPKDFILLLEIINEKGIDNILKIIEKLNKMKKSLVTTDNIKSMAYNNSPSEDIFINIDDDIKNASINMISHINNIFNLTTTEGGKMH